MASEPDAQNEKTNETEQSSALTPPLSGTDQTPDSPPEEKEDGDNGGYLVRNPQTPT
ncbi:hypothetical protein IMZ48_06450 [Candidatus Bathyarchaeota archaeon]|nr:hypothetical protein [Candidatus Bathyarchaeota archaeon]